MSLEVNGNSYETDEEGYLANLSDWAPDLAEAMAFADGAELADGHWEVINFLREYYEEYQIAPAVRVLTKTIGKRLGKDKGNLIDHAIFWQAPCLQVFAQCIYLYTGLYCL